MAGTLQRCLRLAAWRPIHAMPAREVVMETADGRLAFDNNDWLIGKKLYVDRAFESQEIDAWVGALRGGGWVPAGSSAVADAGANIGMVAIAMLLRGHFARAFAFEPAPRSYSRQLGDAPSASGRRLPAVEAQPQRPAGASRIGRLSRLLVDNIRRNGLEGRLRCAELALSSAAGTPGDSARNAARECGSEPPYWMTGWLPRRLGPERLA